MSVRSSLPRLVVGLVLVVLAIGAVAGGAAAAPDPADADVVVDDDGVECTNPDASTIQDGIVQANPGDVILVCSGTYSGATVDKSVTLSAQTGAVMDGGSTGTGFDVAASGVTIEGFTIQNFDTGIQLSATNTETLENVQIKKVESINNDGAAIHIDSQGSATIRDVLVKRGLVRGSADGVTIESGVQGGTGTAEISNITFDTTGLNDTDPLGTGFSIDANAQTTVEDIALRTVEGGGNNNGVDINVTDSATVSGLVFDEYRAVGNGNKGVLLEAGRNGTSDTATIEDVSFETSAINNTAGPGLMLMAFGEGQFRNVSVKSVALSGNDRGVLLRQSDGGRVRLRVNRTLIEGSNEGVVVDSVGSAAPRLDIRQSLIRNNGKGVVVTGPTDPSNTEVRFSFITGNNVGISNQNTSAGANVFAQLNYWGSDSGPGTPSGASVPAVEDPLTGTLADGSGDTVSERGTSGVSNVVFDPWLGKPVCSGPQMIDVSSQFVTFPTVSVPGSSEEVSTAQVAPICAWERSILPFRTDSDDAATNVELPQMFLELSNGDQASLNRDKLSVFQQGTPFDIRYRDATGANTEKFAGADAQLVVIRGSSAVSLQNAIDDIEINRTSGRATVDLNGADVRVLDDAEGVTEVDSTGALDATFTPSSADQYVFALFERKHGEGLDVQNGNLTLEGGVDLIGVETATVQQTSSVAEPGRTNATYTAGEDVDISVDSTLGSGNTTHTVLLYNASTVDAQTVVIGLEQSADAYINGNADLSDVTIETSISGVKGAFLSETDATVTIDTSSLFLGSGGTVTASITEGRTNGTVSTSALFDDLAPNVTTTITSPSTRLNASVAVAVNTSSSRVITVPTETDLPAGTYEFVHIAQQGSGTDSFSTDSGTVTIEAPTTPTPPPTTPPTSPPPSVGGGGGGGGAPPQPTAPFVVVDTSINPERIAPGESTTVSVTVQNTQPNSPLLNRNVIVTVAGDRKAIRTITLGPGERRTVEIPITLTEEGRFTVEVNGKFAGLVTVLPENVLERSESRVFDQNSRKPGVQVGFTSTAVREITFPEAAAGRARVDQLRRLPQGVPQAPGISVLALDITVPEPLRDQGATIQFGVEQSQLDELGLEADSIRMYRWNDGEWQPLNTTLVRESDGTLIYEAQTPGFSIFAVTGQEATPTPTPTPTTPTPTPEPPTATPTDTPTDTASPEGPTTTTPGGGGISGVAIALGALIIILLIAAAGAALYLSQEGSA